MEEIPADIGVEMSAALSSNALSSNALSSNALSSNALSSNALSSNALSSNALSSNALSSNALSSNALSSNGLYLNPATTHGLVATADGRELLGYVVRCALEEGEVLFASVGRVDYEFTGLLGLLPDWRHGPLSLDGQEILSACLAAHVNYFNVSVPISIRNDRLLSTSDDESSRFVSYEGTFFGNMVSGTGTIYACGGDAAPDFDVQYPGHDLTAGDRLMRRCTDSYSDRSRDPSSTGETTTACGFTYVGRCRDVCDTEHADGHRTCWTNIERTGHSHDGTLSVWLLAYDDSDSVWPELYDEVYGR